MKKLWGLAVVALLAVGFAVRADAQSGPQHSAVWAIGPTISVPSGQWTAVTWSMVPLNSSSFTFNGPEFTSNEQALWNLIVEVAWANGGNTTGRRSVRFRYEGWTSAQVDAAPIVTTGGEPQNLQLSIQPGNYGPRPNIVEVYQDSGQPVELVQFGFSAPSLMIAKYGPV